VLAVIANLKPEEASVEVTLNGGRVGLGRALEARDPIDETPMTADGQTILPTVPGQDVRIA